MKRHVIIFTILSLFVFGLTSVYAQPMGMGQGQGQGQGQGPCRGQGLAVNDSFPQFTTQQLDQMDKLKSDHQKAMIPVRADLQIKEIEYREMLRMEAGQSALNAKLDEIGKIKTQISKMRLDHQLKMQNILTAEQKEFMKSHGGPGFGMGMGKGMGRHFDRGDKGRGRGMDRPGGPPRGQFEDDADNGDEPELGMEEDDIYWGMQGNCNLPCPSTCLKQ